jgi:acetyl-CoA carboxylase carboxyltransferase component
VQAIFGPELDKFKASGEELPKELQERIQKTRADYERWLDARYAAARGHVDALIDPLETRRVLSFALDVCAYSGSREHLALETL